VQYSFTSHWARRSTIFFGELNAALLAELFGVPGDRAVVDKPITLAIATLPRRHWPHYPERGCNRARDIHITTSLKLTFFKVKNDLMICEIAESLFKLSYDIIRGIVNLRSSLWRLGPVCLTRRMNTLTPANPYKNHRFPAEIIGHAVWLYFRFCLSHRNVEELLFARGIIVTYEAIRKWCRKFGQQYANELRRCRPKPGDKWHPDEVFLTINGEQHYL
jgi:hypothetical protein